MTGFPVQSVESAPRVDEFGAHGNCRTRVKTYAEEVESIVWSSSFLRITFKIDSTIRLANDSGETQGCYKPIADV